MQKLSFLFLLFVFFACRKDPVLTDGSARLSFSQDTLAFDTVFTSVGSVTKRFRVYNHNSKRVIISSISLGMGNASMFRLNVDGMPGKSFTDIEIKGKDSLFIFVEVTVNPNNVSNPLVISDEIVFQLNGNTQTVGLTAWGQDAYFHVGAGGGLKYFSLGPNSQTWKSDKPHVVYGYAIVDSATTLTIPAGTKVYFHSGSGLIVYKEGSLKVKGTVDKPVVFQGDRLELAYANISKQWDRIWLSAGSKDNEIDYAVIKNGNVGLQADTVANANPTLKINNTIIENMLAACLLAQGATIKATNCVFANSSQYLTLLTLGGDYDFRHCTFANFYRGSRQTPSLVLNNYYTASSGLQLRALKNAYFGNCIIYGNVENEVVFDYKTGTDFTYKFDHCILKIDPKVSTTTSNYVSILKNPTISNDSTIFRNTDDNNYELSNNSIAIDQGVVSVGVAADLKGKLRTGIPDLGAYEK